VGNRRQLLGVDAEDLRYEEATSSRSKLWSSTKATASRLKFKLFAMRPIEDALEFQLICG
jgi:hypothetical protein